MLPCHFAHLLFFYLPVLRLLILVRNPVGHCGLWSSFACAHYYSWRSHQLWCQNTVRLASLADSLDKPSFFRSSVGVLSLPIATSGVASTTTFISICNSVEWCRNSDFFNRSFWPVVSCFVVRHCTVLFWPATPSCIFPCGAPRDTCTHIYDIWI